MLDIYRNYLLNIRNSLIQCGVSVPVESVDEYPDICKLQQELDDILYYYNILANSNSTDKLENFFIKFSVPLRKRIGDESYKEFLEFWEEYKKMSSSYAVYQNLCVKLQELNKELTSGGGYNVDSSVTTEDKQEKDSKEDIKAEVDRQREDMFRRYYEPKVFEEEVKKEEIKKNRASLFEDLFGGNTSEETTENNDVEEVSFGVNLDEDETTEKSNDVEEVPFGVNLDEDETEDTSNSILDDFSEEDAEGIFSAILSNANSSDSSFSEGNSSDDEFSKNTDVELVSHGNYLEDMIDEESEESNEEDDSVTYVDEEDSSWGIPDEEVEEQEDDEDDSVIYVDEDESSNWMSDDDSEEAEEYDEDDGITYEDEDESGNWMSDDDDSEEVEEEYNEDDGITYVDEDDSSWGISDGEDSDEDADLTNIEENDSEEVQVKSVDDVLNIDESKKEPEKDILDTLQSETSKFVNRGYRTIKNLEKRLKGM